jgi:hypothetical protein
MGKLTNFYVSRDYNSHPPPTLYFILKNEIRGPHSNMGPFPDKALPVPCLLISERTATRPMTSPNAF